MVVTTNYIWFAASGNVVWKDKILFTIPLPASAGSATLVQVKILQDAGYPLNPDPRPNGEWLIWKTDAESPPDGLYVEVGAPLISKNYKLSLLRASATHIGYLATLAPRPGANTNVGFFNEVGVVQKVGTFIIVVGESELSGPRIQAHGISVNEDRNSTIVYTGATYGTSSSLYVSTTTDISKYDTVPIPVDPGNISDALTPDLSATFIYPSSITGYTSDVIVTRLSTVSGVDLFTSSLTGPDARKTARSDIRSLSMPTFRMLSVNILLKLVSVFSFVSITKDSGEC